MYFRNSLIKDLEPKQLRIIFKLGKRLLFCVCLQIQMVDKQSTHVVFVFVDIFFWKSIWTICNQIRPHDKSVFLVPVWLSVLDSLFTPFEMGVSKMNVCERCGSPYASDGVKFRLIFFDVFTTHTQRKNMPQHTQKTARKIPSFDKKNI